MGKYLKNAEFVIKHMFTIGNLLGKGGNLSSLI